MSDAPRIPDDAAIDPAEILDQEPVADEAADDLDIEEPEELEPPPDEGGEPEPAARPSRGENRIQRLVREREEARREAAELRGYRQALEQRQQQPAAQDPYAAQRQTEALSQRWAEMAMNGQHAQVMQEQMSLVQQQIQQSQTNQYLAFNDRLDRQSYESQARTSPSYQRYAPEVERELANWRARGVYDITRQQIYYMLSARDSEQRAARAAPQQRRAAAGRVAGQQTRPTNARSDGARTSARPAPGSPEDDDRLVDEYFSNGGRL